MNNTPTPKVVPQQEHRNYNGIDLFKFISAVFVFILHIPPFQGEISIIAQRINFGMQHCLCRLAVPFYFVSSGFFLFRKMSPEHLDFEAIKTYCFKLLRLLGIWTFLLFIGGTRHLWYLGATVTAITLLSVCFYFRMKFKHLCILGIFLYIIGLLGDSYFGILAPLTEIPLFDYLFKAFKLLFSTTRNGVFMGFLFVLMGVGFSLRPVSLKPRTSLVWLVVSLLCLFAEVFLLDALKIPIEYNMYIFLIPAVFFLFAFAHALPLKDRPVYRQLRTIGLLIYFTHLFFYKFVSLAVSAAAKFWNFRIVQYQFLITIFVTLLFAMFIERISRKETFKWIHWFLT